MFYIVYLCTFLKKFTNISRVIEKRMQSQKENTEHNLRGSQTKTKTNKF